VDALRALKERRSVRSFTSEPVAQDVVEELIDCARLAPTARNVQPWEFVAVTDNARCRELADMTDHGKFIADAPVCIAVFCEDTKYFLEDGSAATTVLLLAAHAVGLGSCWVAGDKKPYADQVRRLLDVPDGYRLVALVALGYPDDAAPRKGKRPLSEVIHWENW